MYVCMYVSISFSTDSPLTVLISSYLHVNLSGTCFITSRKYMSNHTTFGKLCLM